MRRFVRDGGLAGRLWLVLALAGLLHCGGEPASGPGPVAWDRDTCERCQMVISDRAFAAQVRSADGRLHRFDDPGCAVLWLDDHANDAPAREIWVRAVDADGWLDARRARYVPVPRTPMGYGFGASQAAGAEGIDFAALRDAIRARERERRHPAG